MRWILPAAALICSVFFAVIREAYEKGQRDEALEWVGLADRCIDTLEFVGAQRDIAVKNLTAVRDQQCICFHPADGGQL